MLKSKLSDNTPEKKHISFLLICLLIVHYGRLNDNSRLLDNQAWILEFDRLRHVSGHLELQSNNLDFQKPNEVLSAVKYAIKIMQFQNNSTVYLGLKELSNFIYFRHEPWFSSFAGTARIFCTRWEEAFCNSLRFASWMLRAFIRRPKLLRQ